LKAYHISRVALIAAAYAALTVALAPISYGPIQVRVSEALTVLAFVTPAAVPGLFLGCFIANLVGGLGLVDVVLGSAATLAAALLTRRMPSPLLAPLPPVLVNAVVVGGYLSVLTRLPFITTFLYVGFGQVLACYGLGYPLLLWAVRSDILRRYFHENGKGNGNEGGQ
jgi:uncharacterized membrane protein